MGNGKPSENSFLLTSMRTRTSPTGVIHRLVVDEPKITDGVPKRPYQETRKDRENVHRVFQFLGEVPLDVVDKELKGVVIELADGDDMVEIRQLSNSLGRRVNGLGYQGGLELLARLGVVLGDIEGDQ